MSRMRVDPDDCRYKCRDCGTYFASLKRVEEDRGEFWGIPCTETVYYCPHCDSEDFDEADVVEKEEWNAEEDE